jgi:16S rRNA (guanine527-N7)-methyltransferase
MISHHIFDGLTLVDHIYNYQYVVKNIIDIGSGMGVPAIILAICFPELDIYAIDCNNKKNIFLKQVAIELNLKNLHIINKKIENYQRAIDFNIITARAFANIEKLINLTKHIVNDNTFYLLMKSKKIYKELESLDFIETKVYDVKIPNYEDIRYIVKLNIKR